MCNYRRRIKRHPYNKQQLSINSKSNLKSRKPKTLWGFTRYVFAMLGNCLLGLIFKLFNFLFNQTLSSMLILGFIVFEFIYTKPDYLSAFNLLSKLLLVLFFCSLVSATNIRYTGFFPSMRKSTFIYQAALKLKFHHHSMYRMQMVPKNQIKRGGRKRMKRSQLKRRTSEVNHTKLEQRESHQI